VPIRSWGDLLNDAGGAGDSFEPLPSGDYDFEISQADVTQTQNGKTMYKVRCKVESGPHANRLVFHNFVISPENPNALAMFFRQMNVLGLNRDFFGGNPSDHQVAEALQGKRFRGQVTIKQWQGQDRNEIKQFFTAVSGALGNGSPLPGGGSQPGQGVPNPGPGSPAPGGTPAPAPAPAPSPAPPYSAPAQQPAPQAPQQEQQAPQAPVQQPETPPVQTPDAPPAQAPAAPPAPPAQQANVPAPPPF
jgi:hypothetical protein